MDSTEQNLKGQISQLEGQLGRTNEALVLQEKKVAKFKESMEEAMDAHKKAMDDNEQLIEDLKKANSTIHVSVVVHETEVWFKLFKYMYFIDLHVN